MLHRQRSCANSGAGDYRASEQIGAPTRATDGGSRRRRNVVFASDERPFEVDQDVHADEDHPKDGDRPVQPPGDDERVSVHEAHGNAATEQDNRGGNQQRGEQTHRELRRALQAVCLASRVVAREAPTGARQLEKYWWNQDEADEHVQREELVQAEDDRSELDDGENQQYESDGCCQALVPIRVHPFTPAARPVLHQGNISFSYLHSDRSRGKKTCSTTVGICDPARVTPEYWPRAPPRNYTGAASLPERHRSQARLRSWRSRLLRPDRHP